MNFQQFQNFIDKQDAFFRKIHKLTPRERTLSRTVKVSEEFGELCDEVLSSFGDQRKSKMAGKTKETLESEFADVVITVFMLAKSMDIDIPKALAEKIPKILSKHNKEQVKK